MLFRLTAGGPPIVGSNPMPERSPVSPPAAVAEPPAARLTDAAAARTADAATAARSAPPEPADAAGAAAVANQGSLFIDFLNTYPDGEIEVVINGRKRWTERLGVSQQGGGLTKLKLQRVSEPMGTQIKLPEGDHKVTVTLLNGDGEVRNFGTTNVHVSASRSMTLKVRTTRFKNELQLDSTPGEPVLK